MSPVAYQQKENTLALECFDDFMHDNLAGIFFVGSDARVKKLNQRAAEILGYGTPSEVEGLSLSRLEFFFSQNIVERLQHLLRQEHHLRIDCFPGTNLKGHFAHYSLSCNRAHDENDDTAGILGIIEDVSVHVKRQQELKNHIDEMAVLSQISQAVSSALDTKEVLEIILTGVTASQGLGFNRAFLFLMDDDNRTLVGRLAIGPTSAEEAGKIWSSLADDPRSLVELLSLYREKSDNASQTLTDIIRDMRIDTTNGSVFARAVQEKTPLTIEYDSELDHISESILKRLGEKQVSMTPLLARDRVIGLLLVDNAITREEITENDRRFLKLIADQTATAVERSYLYRDLMERALELERMNGQLAQTQNQIIEAEKMSVIGEITSAVAHELRNPLTIIGGFANLMNKNLTPGSGDGEYLNIIISETQRAEAVLTDVLDFSKASKTKGRRLDLNDLVSRALDMLRVRMGAARSRISFERNEADLPLWGNPDQLLHSLYQVFQVLVQDLPIDLPRASTHRLGDTLRLEVCFPSPDKLRKKVDNTLRQYFGCGNSTKRLTLLVAEETLKHHGGVMGVESHPDDGPVLFVHLPLNEETQND